MSLIGYNEGDRAVMFCDAEGNIEVLDFVVINRIKAENKSLGKNCENFFVYWDTSVSDDKMTSFFADFDTVKHLLRAYQIYINSD